MSSLTTRARALVAYDGALAHLLIGVLQVFLVSVSFLAATSPVWLFALIVGWQPTHLAIALFAASTWTVAPAVTGALAAASRILDERAEAHAGRAFWRSFAGSCRSRWRIASGTAAIAWILSYDVALFSDTDGVLLLTLAGGGLLLVAVVATGSAPDSPLPGALRAAAQRPHLALAWLLLAVIAIALCVIPVVGASLMLFSPGLAALSIQICNRALGFRPAR
ncbi:hypothetical protein GCM10010910_18430 [Microbacterium nanhaiense]|uniref:DUF624 domain-containing protein n=1 Tax=Microbacterium nanhaiense TaxID=1301026 RepID=A0ABQ2N237_9MICO|nr:hypothetical protein [Microbacterium nanhaiense]GGO64184.1 hypothetical protein GCM10010910_18430 [Microbacterium nanhaiense]